MDKRFEDRPIVVEGKPIGGTYYCCADHPRYVGKRWACWGPNGYSWGHRTRKFAEDFQKRKL